MDLSERTKRTLLKIVKKKNEPNFGEKLLCLLGFFVPLFENLMLSLNMNE